MRINYTNTTCKLCGKPLNDEFGKDNICHACRRKVEAQADKKIRSCYDTIYYRHIVSDYNHGLQDECHVLYLSRGAAPKQPDKDNE